MYKNKFPILETKSLMLRRLKESHWESVSYLRSDKIVNQFVKRANADTKEKALSFINEINSNIGNGMSFYWSITIKDIDEIIGSICLWNFSLDEKTSEIGYDLAPKFQHKGIMSESILAVLNYGFQILNLEKIEAYTHKQNQNSIKLLNKNGFKVNIERFDKSNSGNLIFELNRPTKSIRTEK